MDDVSDEDDIDLFEGWLDEPETRNMMFQPSDMAGAGGVGDAVSAVRIEAAEIRKCWELPWRLPFDDPMTEDDIASNGGPDHDETLEIRQSMAFLLEVTESDDLVPRLSPEIVAFVERDLLGS